MGHQVTIGGKRLGSGNKMKAYLHGYERSTHDLSQVIRTTMAAGTIVPTLTEVALPGDTFDIQINMDGLTHPTIGPLFGSYTLETHLFQIPMHLYNSRLQMNMVGIGRKMNKVALPQIVMEATELNMFEPPDNQQINPSSIFAYLGMRGLASLDAGDPGQLVFRQFNAIPWLGYWDIVKQYYANKQEGIGMVIHNPATLPTVTITSATLTNTTPNNHVIPLDGTPPYTYTLVQLFGGGEPPLLTIVGTGITDNVKPEYFKFAVKINGEEVVLKGDEIFDNWFIDTDNQKIIASKAKYILLYFGGISYSTSGSSKNTEPTITSFNLEEIDNMRHDILQQNSDTPFLLDSTVREPYALALENAIGGYSKEYAQEGLALKTYKSDLFNNWLDTEWIDGVDGISAVTAVDTSGGSFTIDELNLSRKIYDMLNRIALSGGTYDDWVDAVYEQERRNQVNNPIYLGGLIKKIVFQEVVSNAASEGQPLGTLAGRGRLSDFHKGGNIVAKISEPSYIMALTTITPNVEYSQGNKWDVNLKTMDDLHKPALDQIGFQDLITDQMAWFDSEYNSTTDTITFKSAGKQPAWINYMTAINRTLGNFADQNQQMFMVLNRRYELGRDQSGFPTIKDLTTYIDPSKFNHIFADTRRDAQNFWVQVGFNIEARRKMSAKIIPNL